MECVVNVSEGQNVAVLAELDSTVPTLLLDRHSDAVHHRSVFTLLGEPGPLMEGVHRLTTLAVQRLTLVEHVGVHPRIGVVDVVPFAPFVPGQLPPTDLSTALSLRNDFARWCATELKVPAFLYGPGAQGERTLPDVRRHAFSGLSPDFGTPAPHPTAGAVAVGARPVMVAYNVWVDDLKVARKVATAVRDPSVRTLAIPIVDRAQVSTNLINPGLIGPADVYDDVSRMMKASGGTVFSAELVGLLPEAILHAIPPARWEELGLSEDTTIESRWAALAK